jgi:hypothetical protein
MDKKLSRVMVIGKGSLFLGRMTNLFDGVSFILQQNSGAGEEESVSETSVRKLIADSLKDFAKHLQGDEG